MEIIKTLLAIGVGAGLLAVLVSGTAYLLLVVILGKKTSPAWRRRVVLGAGPVAAGLLVAYVFVAVLVLGEPFVQPPTTVTPSPQNLTDSNSHEAGEPTPTPTPRLSALAPTPRPEFRLPNSLALESSGGIEEHQALWRLRSSYRAEWLESGPRNQEMDSELRILKIRGVEYIACQQFYKAFRKDVTGPAKQEAILKAMTDTWRWFHWLTKDHMEGLAASCLAYYLDIPTRTLEGLYEELVVKPKEAGEW